MNMEMMHDRLFEALTSGDRPGSRGVVEDAARAGVDAAGQLTELFWPVYERIERFHRADRLSTLAHHMGTRLLRMLVDQASRDLERSPDRGRTVFAVCGPTDADELGAQMAVDMLEADGYSVSFAAGSIAGDEILAHVQESRPDVLLLFASAPSDLPGVRWLIDTLREINACDRTQVVVGGGVFTRAEGLAEEIGADLWATGPRELVRAMEEAPERRAAADQRTVGKNKRRAVA